jgi:hypothetical protein
MSSSLRLGDQIPVRNIANGIITSDWAEPQLTGSALFTSIYCGQISALRIKDFC